MHESELLNFETDVVCQFDVKQQKIVKEFNNLNDLFNEFKGELIMQSFRSQLLKNLKGKSLTFRNFAWIRKKDLNKIGFEEFAKQRTPTKVKKLRILKIDYNFENDKVCQIDIFNKNIVKKYNNIEEIEEELKNLLIKSSIKTCINNCLNDKQKLCINFGWFRESKLNEIGIEKFCKDRLPRSSRQIIENEGNEEKMEREEKLDNYSSSNIALFKGYLGELYMYELLLRANIFKDITLIGGQNCDTDLIINIDNNIEKALQIKTLSFNNFNGSYFIKGTQYKRNILIAGINDERNKFLLIFSDEIGEFGLSMSFDNPGDKYKNKIYTDVKQFLRGLQKLIYKSVDYKDFIGAVDSEKEYNSLIRANNWFSKLGFDFKRNLNPASSIDFFVNGIGFQAKYSSYQASGYTYGVHIRKNAGSDDGTKFVQSYSEGQFDIMMIELGGPSEDKTKYHNNFFFMTDKEMGKLGYLRNESFVGKQNIHICIPDYDKFHLTKKYWHKDLIINEIKNWKYENINTKIEYEELLSIYKLKESINNEVNFENDPEFDLFFKLNNNLDKFYERLDQKIGDRLLKIEENIPIPISTTISVPLISINQITEKVAKIKIRVN